MSLQTLQKWFQCKVCGGTVYAEGERAKCRFCGTTYKRSACKTCSPAKTIQRLAHPQLASATLTLILEAPVGYRIGAFGITSQPLPYGYGIWPYCADPAGSGDTSNRAFTFKADEELIIFGKLFKDTAAFGGALVTVDVTGPLSVHETATTGTACGEFNVKIPANTLKAGTYTVKITYG